MSNAALDQNSRPTLTALSSTGDGSIVDCYADPTTHRLLVDSASGSGSVTSVSVVTANGLAGTVATATTTPAITLSTTINSPVLSGNGTAIGAATTTGSGSTVVLQTSPTLITPALGTPTSGVLSSCTGLPLTSGVTGVLPVANGGTNTNSASITAFNNITGYTASGATGTTSTNIVFSTSPTLITPTLGAATATSINGNTFTTGTYTLTGTAGKTLTFSNSITLAGTDATTMTFPSTTATIARTDAAQTFTGVQTTTQVLSTNNAITASGNAATVPVTSKINTVTNNSAATLTITFTTAGAIDGQMVVVRILDFSAVAQTLTLVNTENSTTIAPTSTNGSTTLPLTLGLQFNVNTTKWRIIASA